MHNHHETLHNTHPVICSTFDVPASANTAAAAAAARRSNAYCPAALRTWASRWLRIAGELAAYQPDILCMQVGAALDVMPWQRRELQDEHQLS
jgi:mRNA deadenylase 3'-5' endonuclease subunit Ccr4